MAAPTPHPDLTPFVHSARVHLTVIRGRLEHLRRDAHRERTDLPACVGRLDDIELSVRRLEDLITDLEARAR